LTDGDMSDESDEIKPSHSESEYAPGGTEVEVGSGPEEEPEQIAIPEILPVLPLKNTVLFPFLLSPLLVKSPRSRRVVDEVLLTPDRLLVCTAVRRPVEGSPGTDDVYHVGTVMRIVKMLKFPDDSYRLLVQGVARVRVEKFVAEEPFLRGRIHRLVETGFGDSVETTALVRSISQQFGALVAESPRLSDELQILAANLEDASKLGDLVGSNLEFDVAGKQHILEELHIPTRLWRR
jgi:ATP-dependent Lon protease